MTNNIAFQTTERSLYLVEQVDADQAAAVGCPGSDFRIIGRNGAIYGSFEATGRTPGREVRVPGWSTRKGIRVLFVPAVLDETVNSVPVDGFLAGV